MTDEELTALLDDIESDCAERKESLSDKEKIRQAICAFANDLPDHRKPGVLFIGVDDRGNPTGLPITDPMLQDLASMKSDGNILPFPSLTVQKRILKGREAAVVLVSPADAPPIKYKGVVWVRVGPRRGLATPDDERRLNEKRRFKDLPPDLRPFESAKISELDELLFKRVYLPSSISDETLRQNQRDFEHQLIATKFANAGPPISPTMLGLLTVGKSPTDWIPGAYIQFLRIDGTRLGDRIQTSHELRGALPDLMMELEELLKLHIQTASDFTSGPVELTFPDYPLAALQQITRNAVMHRSYESTHAPARIYWFKDRVEVHNPGGPFGQVNPSNFGKPEATDYRNPNLAAVMKELGYVQRFGFGIAVARAEMAKNGNPPPEFDISESHVAVILRKRA